MSPYLFHMTSRENLKNILEYKHTKKGEGVLKVQKPILGKKNTYEVKMVCFTDSPPFALDFFRYRWSKAKNRENFKYGIGFDKEKLVEKGVFPNFYVAEELQAKILDLTTKSKYNDLLKKLKYVSCDDKETIQELKKLLAKTYNTLSSVKRLMFPLLEKEELQGYIWEREWRYTTPNNLDSTFVFSYDDIRIICCDDEDEDIFKTIIGEDYIERNKIQFIRTWQQYNEITGFLAQRTQNINTINVKIQEKLDKKINEKEGIDRYLNYLQNQAKKINEIENFKDNLDEEIKKISEEIEKKKFLVELCKNIIEVDSIPKKLEIKIMETDCEIIINSIAAYQEYKNYQESKNSKINYPASCLIKAIDNTRKPKSNKFKQELDKIRKQMKEIIEKL